MAGHARRSGPPPSAGVLARYAQAYARELGVAEGRVRAWIAYMILAGILERVHLERFKDLIDLLLMETLIAYDYAALREACELVFRSRKTHPWPPNFDVMPAHWAAPFAALASELALPQTDLDSALVEIRRLVTRILNG